MAQHITEIWEGLRAAGLPEVMLYLPDQSASRCHWKDTTLIGETRVALLADQDRQIVRILPVDACVGIGIASPKGVDPSGYKTVVLSRLIKQFGGMIEGELVAPDSESAEEAPDPAPPPVPLVQPVAPEPSPPAPTVSTDPLAGRWGGAQKQAPPGIRVGGGSGTFGNR